MNFIREVLSTKRSARIAAAFMAIAFVVTACSGKGDDSKDNESAREREGQAATQGFDRLTQSQQIPVFDFSQERQTLIEVLTLRAQGTHGTASR